MPEVLPARLALQAVQRLKQGANVIHGAHLFSVGREDWLGGAVRVFADLEATGDSTVRFIRGDYGVGKTNFAARLFRLALERGWVVSFVEISDAAPLHEFHRVYAALLDNLRLPGALEELDAGEGQPPAGIAGLLDGLCRQMSEGLAGDPFAVREELVRRVSGLLAGARIHGDFAAAVRCWARAALEGNQELRGEVAGWFRAEPDVTLPAHGVLRPMGRANAKEHLRALTALVVALGYRGTLVVLDELERVMDEPPVRRRKAYTLLRELIDNVDGVNGMVQACLYCSAPPGQFESQKGFIEVEALASRIQLPNLGTSALVDYTGAVVDLDRSPLSLEDKQRLARNLRALHGAARAWAAASAVSDGELDELVARVAGREAYGESRVRDLCKAVMHLLETRYASGAGAGDEALAALGT